MFFTMKVLFFGVARNLQHIYDLICDIGGKLSVNSMLGNAKQKKKRSYSKRQQPEDIFTFYLTKRRIGNNCFIGSECFTKSLGLVSHQRGTIMDQEGRS